MSPEFWAIIGIGAALLLLLYAVGRDVTKLLGIIADELIYQNRNQHSLDKLEEYRRQNAD